MAILEPLGGILGLKVAILERLGAHLGSTWVNLEALGRQGRHMGGIWEAFGTHKGSKREPNEKTFLRPGGMRGARVLISTVQTNR